MHRGRVTTSICWILILLLAKDSRCQSILDKAANLLLTLLEPVPQKGTPFPAIPGPLKEDKVCIVGAGPAGIHMAQKLKKLGYQNIKLFEKTDRVGGKSFDMKYRGTVHPQGTIYLEGNHFDNLVPLAKEYDAGELVKIPPYNFWATNSANDTNAKLAYGQFILSAASKSDNIMYLIQTLVRYGKVHKEMFGDYEGDIMPKPDVAVMHRIRGTFLDFLSREDMLALVPLMKGSTELQGFGYIDEVSALYGLIWNNPKLIVSLGLRALRKDKAPNGLFVLKDGFQKVWKNIAMKEELNIVYNVNIVSMRRASKKIYMRVWKDQSMQYETCDFMIWTPPMKSLLRILQDVRLDENHSFNGLKSEIFTSNLVNMKNEIRNGPHSAYLTNINGKIEGSVRGEVRMRAFFTDDIGTPGGLAKYDRSNSEIETVCVLQGGRKRQDRQSLNNNLINHYTKGFNATDVEILNTISWNYFPRWNQKEMEEGRHWQVFNMQGKQNMWYAGSSVSFETVRSVMGYNNLLLRNMYAREDNPVNKATTRKSTYFFTTGKNVYRSKLRYF